MRQCLNAERRSKTTRSELRLLRASGKLPGVIYGNDTDAISVSVATKDIQKQLRSGRTELIDLDVEGAGKVPVMLAEVQRDGFSGELLHIDFQQVAMDHTIRVKVPVEYVGTAPGIKAGGILQVQETTIEIEGLPASIPPVIQVDISAMELGDKLYTKDVTLPSGISMSTHPEHLIAAIAIPRGVKEETAEESTETTETEAS